MSGYAIFQTMRAIINSTTFESQSDSSDRKTYSIGSIVPDARIFLRSTLNFMQFGLPMSWSPTDFRRKKLDGSANCAEKPKAGTAAIGARTARSLEQFQGCSRRRESFSIAYMFLQSLARSFGSSKEEIPSFPSSSNAALQIEISVAMINSLKEKGATEAAPRHQQQQRDKTYGAMNGISARIAAFAVPAAPAKVP